MEIRQFGNPAGKTVMLLHGNLMCWRQFEDVISLPEKDYCVYPQPPGFACGRAETV